MFKSKNANILFFVLTLIAGLIILVPSLNYQSMLSQGDHGRDLYAFQMTSKGATPYRDFLWFYGPLMPYYYALFFKILGQSIQSVLLAESILKLLTGIAFFFILRLTSSAFWSFLGTVFFWSFYPYFFFTYNHTGGVLLLLLLFLSLIRYIFSHKDHNLYAGAFLIFLFSLVKINFGIFSLFSYIVCVRYIDKKNGLSFNSKIIFYLTAGCIVPLSILLTYFLLLKGLPNYTLEQCFPYLKLGQGYSTSIPKLFLEMKHMVNFYATNSWHISAFFLLSTVSVCVYLFQKKKLERHTRENLNLILFCLILFFTTHLHEYLISGIFYRVFWAIPFLILIIFVVLDKVTTFTPRWFNIIIISLSFIIIFSHIDVKAREVRRHDHPAYYLGLDTGNVLLGNSPAWIDTVLKTTFILDQELEEGEQFLALPYDALFYFLLKRESPTYQIAFFDFMNIPPEQDHQAIHDINSKNINWIITSNRIMTSEKGLGIFGVTNSPFLAEYINKNFSPVAQLGPWGWEPGWVTNYSIRILKRN